MEEHLQKMKADIQDIRGEKALHTNHSHCKFVLLEDPAGHNVNDV